MSDTEVQEFLAYSLAAFAVAVVVLTWVLIKWATKQGGSR